MNADFVDLLLLMCNLIDQWVDFSRVAYMLSFMFLVQRYIFGEISTNVTIP